MTRLQLALDYAAKGYYVHQLCWPAPDGSCACGRGNAGNKVGKAPLVAGGSTAATRAEATIRAWWAQWPEANIGINTRKSDIVEIASDCPEWARTFTENGMPRTTLYASGGGPGHWHTFYCLPTDVPARNINKPGKYDILAAGNTRRVARIAVGKSMPSRTTCCPLTHCQKRPRGPSRCCATPSRRAPTTTTLI